MNDVVTIGDAMITLDPSSTGPMRFVSSFERKIGGAELNFAIGCARLGLKTGWISRLGNDEFGRHIFNTVRGEGVDTSNCIYTDEAPTGLFFKEKKSPTNIKVYYYRKNSAASLMAKEDIDENYIANAKILHVTGITPALSESSREAVFHAMDLAKKHNVKIVFDPNIRLKLWSEEEAKGVLAEMAKKADVILPGLDEGELITGKKTPQEIAEVLSVDGKKLVIIKLGEKGAYYHTANESGYVDGFKVSQIVDPVGAGDGFAAGVISGILRNEPISEAVRRGNAVGAIVVGVNGDVEGLPTNEEVEQVIRGDKETQDVKR